MKYTETEWAGGLLQPESCYRCEST